MPDEGTGDAAAVEFELRDRHGRLAEVRLATFPPHEHDRFVAHFRGLLGAWTRDEQTRSGSTAGAPA